MQHAIIVYDMTRTTLGSLKRRVRPLRQRERNITIVESSGGQLNAVASTSGGTRPKRPARRSMTACAIPVANCDLDPRRHWCMPSLSLLSAMPPFFFFVCVCVLLATLIPFCDFVIPEAEDVSTSILQHWLSNSEVRPQDSGSMRMWSDRQKQRQFRPPKNT